MKHNKRKKRCTLKHKKRGGVKTSKTSNNVYKTQRSLSLRPIRIVQQPTFIPTEGEDGLEASISFLIELLGGSLYDIYVDDILNKDLSTQSIEVVQVPKPLKPPTYLFVPGKPIIFYGRKSTHFTCTLDGINLWNSYREGIQKDKSDNFCQMFTLMRMESYFFPDSFIGIEYAKLQKGEYLDNVMIAIKSSCHVIELLHETFTIDNYVNEVLEIRDKNNQLEHVKNPSISNINTAGELITNLISYCRSITKQQICNSSFKEKIFLEK
jgi:hypothetical protein